MFVRPLSAGNVLDLSDNFVFANPGADHLQGGLKSCISQGCPLAVDLYLFIAVLEADLHNIVVHIQQLGFGKLGAQVSVPGCRQHLEVDSDPAFGGPLCLYQLDRISDKVGAHPDVVNQGSFHGGPPRESRNS